MTRHVLASVREALALAIENTRAQDSVAASLDGQLGRRRSHLTAQLERAAHDLDQLLGAADHQGERGGTGTLLAGVTNTDADPAHVRESMTDRDANGMLWDSLCRAGTSSGDAQRIADLFVPVQDGSGLAAEHKAKEGAAVTMPPLDLNRVGQAPRFSLHALAESAAARWRTDAIRQGIPLTETWEESVARAKAAFVTPVTGTVGPEPRVPTPKELAEQRARKEGQA